jgi:hypothetical protein
MAQSMIFVTGRQLSVDESNFFFMKTIEDVERVHKSSLVERYLASGVRFFQTYPSPESCKLGATLLSNH